MNEQIVVNITSENGDTLMPFSHLVINQQFNGHHFFELRFNNDVIEKGDSLIVDKAKGYLGKIVTFSFKSNFENYPENIFKGIVSEIAVANNSGDAGDIIFRGYSPTVLLEGGKNLASHNDKSLADIVNKTISGVASNLLNVEVKPVFTKSIPFLVQYHESNFEFLRRLAACYGEYFFYNGVTLYFGKPSSSNTFHLKYPREISDLNFNMKIAPLKFELIEYFSETGDKFSSESGTRIQQLDSFGNFAKDSSNRIFHNDVKNLSHVKSKSESDLNSIAKFKASSKASDLVQITATSDFCFLKPGSQVNISATLQNNKSDEDLGKYMVFNITHTIDGLGNYSNSFDAIAAVVDVVPNQHDKPPVAEPQLGIIKDNKDPDNLGRVKVHLLWQDDGYDTPWIRVMSMHSGGANRGLFFLPEIGDYVVVGFTQNDPDRPFVMGSMPHGKNIDSSKNDDNHIKSIRTRSGSTIYFKDKEKSKQQEIIVKTDDNNSISISVDTGKGTIKIVSNKDIEITSDASISIKSKDIKVEASNQLELKAKTIKIEAQQQLSMEGQQQLSAKGLEVTVEGTTTTSIKSSAQLSIQAGATASIKAPLVQIN